MMNRETFLAILKKYNEGKASQAEVDFINRYYALFDTEPDKVAKEGNDPLKEEILKHIAVRIHKKSPTRQNLFKKWQFAASFLLIISALFAIWYYVPHIRFKGEIRAEIIQHDVPPGGKRAQLILENGKKIDLDEQQNGLLATQHKVQITKTAEGNLNFNASPQKGQTTPARINQLITPPGGQYVLTLADGTKVSLNAASRLSFPSTFTDHQRVVELEGEAYFEVASDDAKPFIVKAKDTEIMVLGTQFNVTAYLDETTTKTTLIDGAVRVNHGHDSKQIKAGMQAVTSKDLPMRVIPVDIKEVTSWKEGYFYFKGESLSSIMRKLQRWYNIDVVYHPKANKAQTFGGMISSQNYISNILSIMELTDQVHFKIEGRRVTVMP